ncbi:sodium- and chloride-dependent glycine transporter 2-like isoform X3, partial [Leptotrombidium deliense]
LPTEKMMTGDENMTNECNNNNDNGMKNRKRNPSDISRGKWGSQWEFLLSCVGLSVGIGNVWRFPYLAYENGGGAFLIPYLIMLFIAGKPMYFMELAIGQFGSSGTLSIWKCAPIAKGVGVAMLSVAAIVSVYYTVVMSYAVFYIWSTFQHELPWSRCDAKWANETNCVVRSQMVRLSKPVEKILIFDNVSGVLKGNSSSQVFWEREVLELSSGIDQLGGIKWDLATCLAISWIVIVLCLIKGVKTSGKIVYFAATFPYVILIALLIAGLTQPGSWQGVKYFLVPEWNKLLEIKVWQAAASQMFFSLSVSEGSLIMY